ncbi:MAG: hypothetical protein COB33_015690 [Thiotrichaceae bacterium]|nr:hypothetical protein [Thiotrichaceae bacterium]
MKNEMEEDFKDLQDIKKQKKEQQDSNEQMSDWEFGKGVKEKEVKRHDV